MEIIPRRTCFLAAAILLTCISACGSADTTPTQKMADVPADLPTPLVVEEVSVSPNPTAEGESANPIQVVVPTVGVAQTAGEPAPRPEFDSFVERIKNGNAEQVVGIYIENVLALRVVQQPPDDPNYVSNVKGVATQFALAYQVAGNVGLLAHNYLSGALFFDIKNGNIAQLVYGDGRVDEYEVTDYHEYQALTPDSPTSDFLDLSTGETLSASDLFNRIYTGEHHLVFQTCIAQDNIDTWGRLFVLSFPY